MERDRLFIEDLAETMSGLRPPPAAEPSPQDVTTQALGEEGDQEGDDLVTTQALGEEGDQDDLVTTQALGEEGDQIEDYHDVDIDELEDQVVTTDAVGEEGDQGEDHHDVDIEEYDEQVVTTDALGEEGDQPEDHDVPDVPIDAGWGTGEPVLVTTDALGESGDLPDEVPADVPIDFPIPLDPGRGDGEAFAVEEVEEQDYSFGADADEEPADGTDGADDVGL